MNYIRSTRLWHKLGVIYLDLGYMLLNTFINHIPAWWLRRLLYKISGIKLGKHCRIGYGTVIVHPHGIQLGDGCIINEYCHLDGRGGLVIGDHASVSVYSKLISASHDLQADDFAYQEHRIVIEDHVFIGAGAIILEGSFLRTGCVIAAGAVAKGEFEEKIIYAGNPIHKIKERNSNCNYSLYHEAYFR